MIADKIDRGITLGSKIVALVLVGWFGSSAYHGTLTLTQKAATLQQVQTVTIPKLAAAVHCEDHRADKATVVAKQAIKDALSDSAPIPSPSALPADNCPHPVGK